MNPLDHENELTPQERAAFDALPRERDPGRLLEERTVRALREAGVLHGAPASVPRRMRFPAWMSGAIAAGIALYLGGVATGQYLAGRNTTQAITALRQHDAEQAALMVQQTGTAYVQALSRLSQVSDTAATRAQGREVASQVLRAAADEVVKMSPNDPIASGILAAFDRADVRQSQPPRDTTARQRVVWF